MSSPVASQVLALADTNGWQSGVVKTRDEREADGQFFSPPLIASCLAFVFFRCLVAGNEVLKSRVAYSYR